MDWVKDGATVVQALAVCVASYAAYRGLTTWRRQLIQGRKIELAEKVLVAVHRTAEAIKGARHPVAWSTEGKTRPREKYETEDDKRRLDGYYVAVERMNKMQDVFSTLNALRIEAQVHFGGAVLEPIRALLEVRRDIDFASQMLIWHLRDDPHPDDENWNKDSRREYERVIWSMGTKKYPDEINDRIDGAVLDAENILMPFLKEN